MKRRRSFDSSSNVDFEPPLKKLKIGNVVKSQLFKNEDDQNQFCQIFDAIDSCSSIIVQNISHCIVKEIAEYATGSIESCASNRCTNLIHLLNEDFEKYFEDPCDANAKQVGFKFCPQSERYFCHNCMDDTITCSCNEHGGMCTMNNTSPGCCAVVYADESKNCMECGTQIIRCECECDCGYELHECDSCQYVCCSDCSDLRTCRGKCRGTFCVECAAWWKYVQLECVCFECYTDEIIECEKCHLKYELLFESNKVLLGNECYRSINPKKMVKCNEHNCSAFVCSECDGHLFDENFKEAYCPKHHTEALKKIKW